MSMCVSECATEILFPPPRTHRPSISGPEMFGAWGSGWKLRSPRIPYQSADVGVYALKAATAFSRASSHFLGSRYFPPPSSSSCSETFSSRNSWSSSLVQGHPSGMSIFIIMRIWPKGIAGAELVSMPTMNCQ